MVGAPGVIGAVLIGCKGDSPMDEGEQRKDERG